MTTDAAVGETCFDNYFTEETFDAAMIRQTELVKEQDESNEDSSSEDSAETEATQNTKPEDEKIAGEMPSELGPSPSQTLMDVDPLQEKELPANNFNDETNVTTTTKNVDNIKLQDEFSDKDNDDDDKNNVHGINTGSNSIKDESSQNVDELKNSTIIENSDNYNSTMIEIVDDSKNSNLIENVNESKTSTLENVILNDDEVPRVFANTNNPSKTTNVVVFSPKNDLSEKQFLNSDIFKGQKVFLLNGNVISKEEVEKTKTDNINIICVSNNLNDIIKNIKSEPIKPGRSLLTNNEIGEKSNNNLTKSIEKIYTTQPTGIIKTISTGPKFIQLTQNNLKSISPKISVNVTPSATKPIAPKPVQIVKKPGEILRTKLLENGNSLSNRNSPEPVIAVKNRTAVGLVKKDEESESPAVAKARSEFIKCRKLLIEAAIHPQLPTYRPPITYDGPVYSCEECDDTFSNMDSLKNHKNRRSVLFTYACPLCKCTLEFYNRCTFLLHVRSHDAAVKACYLTISTIPADKLNFKLLQTEENDELSAPENRTIQRSKERVIIRKETEEMNVNATNGADIKENGINKPKAINKAVDKNSLLKSFDFIKSLKKSKFSTYLQNRDVRKNSVDKDSVSSSSDDSSDDDTSSECKTSEDTTVPNGNSQSSQLKYYLTKDKQLPKNPYKRALEDILMKEDEGNKKLKPNISAVEQDKSKSKPPPAPTPPPVIIKAKPTASQVPKSDDKAEEITLTSSDDDEEEETEKSSEESQMVVCRDCRTEVVNLNKHYRSGNKPLKDYPCEQCKFFNPSACALAAHNRMHTKTQPFICPDCGFYFSTLETFQIHTRQVCYYDYKTIRFQCPQCSLLKPSVPQFAEHLKRCHTRDVFKCSLCITSSYSPKVVEIHMKKKHEGETGNVLEGYRCMLCPNILVSKKSIDTHINKHVFSLKHLRYVYICKGCKKYASGKINKFIKHLSSCQDKKRDKPVKTKEKPTPTKITSSGIPAKRQVKPNRNRTPKTTPATKTTRVEEKDPLSVEEWEADKLKAEYIPKAKICVMCQSADMDKKSNSLFCSACVRYVNAEDNANEHADNAEGKSESGRPKRKFKCRLCKQFMNKDWATITQHYEKDHHSDFNVKKDAKSKQARDSEVKKADTNSPVNIIKKRRPSTKETSSPKIPKLKIPETTPTFKCIKCGCVLINREDFRSHIRLHKEPSDEQCLECGECFMVASSLTKHLLIVHKVDIERYFFENGIVKERDTPEKEILVENQCEVCYLKCDTKQKYDKHMRTHGMAFVAMQSRSKDEKNPRG